MALISFLLRVLSCITSRLVGEKVDVISKPSCEAEAETEVVPALTGPCPPDELIEVWTEQEWDKQHPKTMTILHYLINVCPVLPMSIERPPSDFEPGEKNPSNGEIRRRLKNKAVIVNGKAVDDKFIITLPLQSLVFFPSGKRRTTLI